jgi:hypothetical protein
MVSFAGYQSFLGLSRKIKNELKREHPSATLTARYAEQAAHQAFRYYPSLRVKFEAPVEPLKILDIRD